MGQLVDLLISRRDLQIHGFRAEAYDDGSEQIDRLAELTAYGKVTLCFLEEDKDALATMQSYRTSSAR